MSRYAGESETTLRKAFADAAGATSTETSTRSKDRRQPRLLFIDEIDALAPAAASNSSEVISIVCHDDDDDGDTRFFYDDDEELLLFAIGDTTLGCVSLLLNPLWCILTLYGTLSKVDRRLVATLLALLDGGGSGGGNDDVNGEGNDDNGGNDGGEGQGQRSSGEQKSRFMVIAATNRPFALDPALRRPGR